MNFIYIFDNLSTPVCGLKQNDTTITAHILKLHLVHFVHLRYLWNFQKSDILESVTQFASATHMQTPGVSVSHSPDPSHPTLAFASAAAVSHRVGASLNHILALTWTLSNGFLPGQGFS